MSGMSLLYCGIVGPCFRLKGSRAVLEELLLPALEGCGMGSLFVTQLRDRNLLQETTTKDGNFRFWRVVLPLLLHAFAPFSQRGNACPFPAEPEQAKNEGLGILLPFFHHLLHH